MKTIAAVKQRIETKSGILISKELVIEVKENRFGAYITFSEELDPALVQGVIDIIREELGCQAGQCAEKCKWAISPFQLEKVKMEVKESTDSYIIKAIKTHYQVGAICF